MQGVGKVAPPDWYVLMAAAEAWGVPPWELEDAPALWLDRFVAVANARGTRRPQAKPGQTRLI